MENQASVVFPFPSAGVDKAVVEGYTEKNSLCNGSDLYLEFTLEFT